MTRGRLAISGLVLVVACLFADPTGLTIGFRDSDSYRDIRDFVGSTRNAKALYLASDDDLYGIEPNFRLRAETSEKFVEANYQEILSAASLGDIAFNSYLLQQGCKFVIVPLPTSNRGQVSHKWGRIGEVLIRLQPPYFRQVLQSQGEFPVVLYEVLGERAEVDNVGNVQSLQYELQWSGVRSTFYQPIRTLQELGMYSYTYSNMYEDGRDVSWVFKRTDGYTEEPQFSIQVANNERQRFKVDVTLLAAYGGNAPTQTVRVTTPKETQLVTVSAGKPGVVHLQLEANENVKLSATLPCLLQSFFDVPNGDARGFCFGISNLRIRTIP
jgi:hypothetical protein